MLSIIIPTLNEAAAISATLAAVAQLRGPVEVIVADGGSSDDTVERATAAGARVVRCRLRGRGVQMHAGACAARGDALWFLHADTHPPPEAAGWISEALERPGVVGGNFSLRFDGASWGARWLTWAYPHFRKLGLAFGDSGIFVRRQDYERMGGFRPYPLFEDLDLLRRLKRRGRFVNLPGVLVTSSRRFEDRSFALQFAHWSTLQALYWLGVHPVTLARTYGFRRGCRK